MAGLRISLRVFAALAWLGLTGFAPAADALKGELTPVSARPRTEAPMLFDAKLTWRGSGLLEGVLEITLRENGEPILVQRTQELALSAGVRSFRLLTPPVSARNGYELETQLRFLSRGTAIELGTSTVTLSRNGDRSFLIAVCTPRGTGNDRVHALWQSLRFERFQPGAAAANRQLTTSPAYFTPEDFPSDPLACFAFNLVLLDGEAFGLLREKQLAALARWVSAGGSLCVLPGGGVKAEHLAFLNALAATPQNPAPFTVDAEGRIVGSEIIGVRAGFGRLVVATRPLETDADFDAPEWRRAAAFLWKFRQLQADAAVADGRWRGDANPFRYRREAQDESNERSSALTRLNSVLLPKSTRLIPWPVVALILGVFVVVIGPGDWFVLGWLRRRRWTWALFPLCAAVCTAVTVAAAEHYLGGQDHRATLVITDLGSDGRVARETRFEQLFAARNRDSTTDLSQSIAAPSFAFSRNNYMRSEPKEPPLYTGQFPARYTLRQPLRQWSPQFNRLTSLADAADASGIAWETLDFHQLDKLGMPKQLVEIARRDPTTTFYAFHRDEAATFGPNALKLAGFVKTLCTPGTTGLDAIASTAAPHAGTRLDDLQICDPGDPAQWVIVALRREGADLHLYRRIFRPD